MRPITKVVVGLLGAATIGLVSYYFVSNKPVEPVGVKKVAKIPITTPEKDTVATAKLAKHSTISRASLESIFDALDIGEDEFLPTETPGIYRNSTGDKLLVISEDVWKKLVTNVQRKFPNIAESCIERGEVPDLQEFRFVGLLTYLANNADIKTTAAYEAMEIRYGNSYKYAGGDICCGCGGEPLIPQQVDAVIDK